MLTPWRMSWRWKIEKFTEPEEVSFTMEHMEQALKRFQILEVEQVNLRGHAEGDVRESAVPTTQDLQTLLMVQQQCMEAMKQMMMLGLEENTEAPEERCRRYVQSNHCEVSDLDGWVDISKVYAKISSC